MLRVKQTATTDSGTTRFRKTPSDLFPLEMRVANAAFVTVINATPATSTTLIGDGVVIGTIHAGATGVYHLGRVTHERLFTATFSGGNTSNESIDFIFSIAPLNLGINHAPPHIPTTTNIRAPIHSTLHSPVLAARTHPFIFDNDTSVWHPTPSNTAPGLPLFFRNFRSASENSRTVVNLTSSGAFFAVNISGIPHAPSTLGFHIHHALAATGVDISLTGSLLTLTETSTPGWRIFYIYPGFSVTNLPSYATGRSIPLPKHFFMRAHHSNTQPWEYEAYYSLIR